MSASPVIVAALARVPFFAVLPPAELDRVASSLRVKRYPRGSVIVSQGDDTDTMYVIVAGRAKVCISDDEGKEVIVSLLGPGDYFGEMSLVDDHPRSASIETLEPAELVVISQDEFKASLARNFDMCLAFMRCLVGRLRSADKKIETLALVDVYGRVARALLDMSEPGPDGRRVIRRRVTKQDIARMIGASREMVSRVMKDLVEMGEVEERGDGLVLDPRLERAAR